MGITGELVRSVFSKSQSIRAHDTNNVKGKKWKKSVRAYLCGDELLFNSVLEEERLEVTVTQPVPSESVSTNQGEDFSSDQATLNDTSSEQDHSYSVNSKLLDENAAAFVIQAAFKGFMVRRLRRRESSGADSAIFKGFESPSRESLGTSIEVQTGNSIGVVSIQEECPSVCNSTKLQQKTKSSLFRQKDGWDDSTVDSSVSKMRNRNKLEAMTRRERALAYAFSQQLRICSKKKSTEPNVNASWSWLERWMATRQHEGLSVEDHISRQRNELSNTLKTKPIVRKTFLDLSFEGKESCGSNEVPLQVDALANVKSYDKNAYKSSRNRLKSPRNVSRRKTIPSGHYQKEHTKVNNKEGSREAEDERQKVMQLGSSVVSVFDDDASQLSANHSVAVQNSTSDP